MRYLLLILFSLSSAYGFELVVIQGISKERQTFVTRNTGKFEVFVGKKATFTSENTSVIAKAREVTREFVQWEITNDFTETPFPRGALVTMYDATEYLWALTPEKIKRQYIRNKVFTARRSFETSFSLSRGLSESVTQTVPANADRGGYHLDFMYRSQFDINWSVAYGLRYDRDIINLPDSSLINQRFMGTAELRYYFNPFYDFYNSQLGLGVGLAFGQSRTETPGQATFGNALALPVTKIMLSLPVDRESDVEFAASVEAFRLDEEDVSGIDQTTNLNNTRATVTYRWYIE